MTTQVSPLPGGTVMAVPNPTTSSVSPLPGGTVIAATHVATTQGQGVIAVTVILT